jgi:hypothetical protein
MAGFYIAFTGECFENDPAVAIGKIQLGDHCEFFHAELGFWSIEDYEVSWVEALRRLLRGSSISCLLTSLTDPRHAEFITAWPLYRSGAELCVQNQLIFLDKLTREFDPAAPWESITPHSVTDEDGNQISEWSLSLVDIQRFLEKKSLA